MTTPNTNTPVNPATDAVAIQFVEDQLRAAQASLRRTRAFSIGSMLFVAAYMSFVTWTLQTRLLQPAAAADVATAYVSTFVAQQGDALANELIQQVPAYIAGLPDVFLAELPTVRQDLEQQLEFVLSAAGRDVSSQLGGYLDEYLVNNRDQIVEFLNSAQDPQFVEQFGDHLEQEVHSYLKLQGADGQSALDKLQQVAAGLQAVEVQLNRLAYAKDLTPEEQTLRQLIAVTMRYAKEKA